MCTYKAYKERQNLPRTLPDYMEWNAYCEYCRAALDPEEEDKILLRPYELTQLEIEGLVLG